MNHERVGIVGQAEATGIVESVNISEHKGTPKQPVLEVQVAEDGILGDAHAGPGPRQVSLLAAESIDRFSQAEGRVFRWGEFAENITTRGLDLSNVGPLDRFTVNSVELEVTQRGKACHGDACAIFREVGRCVMPKEGIFCRILHGGALKPGDAVHHVPRVLQFRIITLSDRASSGIYEDRSGPRIKAALQDSLADKGRPIQVETTLLPDDETLLRQELERAKSEGMDAVFTTGGTGIGPRDITPDVVMAMADKLVPGIMEHIRVKFGADKPNALLSRSVAAVLGRTLVYTLPGSVKAVDEYMGEILATLEHAVLMIRGLDAH